MNPVHLLSVKAINRVLSDYPIARERLALYAGKTISVSVAGITSNLRVAAEGDFEMIGLGSQSSAINAQKAPPNIEFDVSFMVPVALVPRLARGDEAAFSEVVFSGDSEFAATLSAVARNVKWDVEEDLSKAIGDVAAHRIVGTARSLNEWQRDTKSRTTKNVAEYLTEEKRTFITARKLELLAVENETLRDDVARLDARIKNIRAALSSSKAPTEHSAPPAQVV